MSILSSERIHASSVSIAGKAVLISGRSGFGKSDLALRLIDRGAILISDDYTIVQRRDGRLHATAPGNIRGQIEVRGIGIVPMETVESAPVHLIVVVDEPVERMPDGPRVQRLAGINVPVVALPALESSAPVKVELALKALEGR